MSVTTSVVSSAPVASAPVVASTRLPDPVQVCIDVLNPTDAFDTPMRILRIRHIDVDPASPTFRECVREEAMWINGRNDSDLAGAKRDGKRCTLYCRPMSPVAAAVAPRA